MNQISRQSRIIQFSTYVIALIFVLLPFHALFTTWLGSNFEHLDLFRIWKEILVVVLMPFVGWVTWRDAKIKRWFSGSWLVGLILAYMLISLAIGVWSLARGNVNSIALIYGLLVNLRFLGFFMVVLVVASQSDFLKKYLRQIVLLPSALVIGFGLLQRFILPYDFLKHFGYGPNTIPAYQTVDQKLSYRRIQSTLRGANPFGTYLVLTIPLIAVLLKKRLARYVLVLAGLVTLFFTYSRSAWLGLAVALGLLGIWSYKRLNLRLVIVFTGASVAIVLVCLVVFRNNSVVENTLFHTDKTSKASISSNASRLSEIKQGLNDIIHEPLGTGPGTAGPASVRNSHPARIAENYFIQIGQEVGLLGLGLFLAINALVAKALWQQRSETLAKIVLATFVGLSLINLVSHAWTDDTVSYMWWGLAAIALAPAILNQKRKRHV